MQELGLSSYSSESREASSKASSDGQQYHALFNTFYKLVYEHIASLVEVNSWHRCGCCSCLHKALLTLAAMSTCATPT